MRNAQSFGKKAQCLSRLAILLAFAMMLGVFYVGLYPQQLFDAVDNATRYLFV